ncbi:hypothetical protein C8J56DRAFT_780606, partial [Mycena floridula]
VRHGLFPTAPLRPRIAVSKPLLDFYKALFGRSCDAVHAIAGALNAAYERNGYFLLNQRQEVFEEPFRRSMGAAVQWYDCLQVVNERTVDDVLYDYPGPSTSHRSTAPDPGPSTPHRSIPTSPDKLSRSECYRLLQKRCPCCFGDKVYGRTFQEGGDIHVALDGNFHHRRNKGAGDNGQFHDAEYILSKEYVDAIGERLDKAHNRPPREYQCPVPDEAVDACRDAHHAAKGDHKYGNKSPFDDKGLMALVCRHDIPLFLANIDSPGEQQKYGVALLELFFHLIPPSATVAAFYDIGCVLSRSVAKYDILPLWISQRLLFLTSAMHAYGHQWSCQLIYNPRLKAGIGLTDGEGVERLWSRFRKLIGVERRSGRSRRLWLIDRQAASIAAELHDDLGAWLTRRHKKGVLGQAKLASKVLKSINVSICDLEEQWKLQREAQLSVRAHAPVRLRKELDQVLQLRSDIAILEKTISSVKATIANSEAAQLSHHVLIALDLNLSSLISKSEELYASLNITDRFPSLEGFNIRFAQTLLIAWDLKINIRKRAIGSFFEWARLDASVRGVNEAAGTKMHQKIRAVIAKRQPVMSNLITRFNEFVEILEEYDCDTVPIPTKLPHDLKTLRDSTILYEDVCIEPSDGPIPRWLADPDVRLGIQAMLKLQRCREEGLRVGREADNLCRLFGRELVALEVATALTNGSPIMLQWSQPADISAYLTPSTRSLNPPSNSPSSLTTLLADMVMTEAEGGYDLDFTPPDQDEQSQEESEWVEDWDDCLSGEDEPASDDESDEEVESAGPFPRPVYSSALISIAAWDWSVPCWLTIDNSLLEDMGLAVSSIAPTDIDVLGNRCFPGTDIEFNASDSTRMRSSTAWYSSGCINSLSSLFRHTIPERNPSTSCATFSTFLFDLSTHTDDETFWINSRNTQYWNKSRWIVPINRHNEHWVISIVLPESRTLLLFDSFAGSQESWSSDVQKLLVMLGRLQTVARNHDIPLDLTFKEWQVRPLVLKPVQTNNYDCGPWIMACILAVLRGCHCSGITSDDIRTLRSYLYQFSLQVPLAS